MPQLTKRLVIWTLILNCLIIIAGGHDAACLGLIELVWLSELRAEKSSFYLTGSFDKTIGFIVLISFVGKLLLIAASLLRFNNGMGSNNGYTFIVDRLFLHRL